MIVDNEYTLNCFRFNDQNDKQVFVNMNLKVINAMWNADNAALFNAFSIKILHADILINFSKELINPLTKYL